MDTIIDALHQYCVTRCHRQRRPTRQLLQNLIGEGIKYGEAEILPSMSRPVSARQRRDFETTVSGIPKQYLDAYQASTRDLNDKATAKMDKSWIAEVADTE